MSLLTPSTLQLSEAREASSLQQQSRTVSPTLRVASTAPVTLIANGIGNVGNGFAQPGLQLCESVGADGLGGGDAVMQTDNGLTVVSGLRGKVLLLVAIQSVPAIAGKQEQNQKNEKEHAFAAPSTVIAFFLAEGREDPFLCCPA